MFLRKGTSFCGPGRLFWINFHARGINFSRKLQQMALINWKNNRILRKHRFWHKNACTKKKSFSPESFASPEWPGPGPASQEGPRPGPYGPSGPNTGPSHARTRPATILAFGPMWSLPPTLRDNPMLLSYASSGGSCCGLLLQTPLFKILKAFSRRLLSDEY